MGATAVLVPEKEYDFQKDVLEKIRAARLAGKTHFMVIVAEGVGSAVDVAKEIADATGLDPRVTVLGHVQRGGSPTTRDRVTASRLGYVAVQALAEGKTNRIACIQNGQYVDIDMVEGLAMKKTLDPISLAALDAFTGA